MQRLVVPPLSTAVLLWLACGQALAATVTFPVKGDVAALAFSATTLIVARHGGGGGLVVERLAAGSPAQVVFSEKRGDPADLVVLAASPEALALGDQSAGNGLVPAPNRVLVGPAGGPLRQVASCQAGLIVSPVAVSGARIAWRDGGCGEPAGNPHSVSPSAIVVGGPDPATVARRTELASTLLPASIFLAGQTGIVGLLSPAFFTFDSQISRLGPTALETTIAEEQGRLTAPVGLLADGTSIAYLADDTASPPAASGGGPEQRSSQSACTTQLFAVMPATSTRRTLSLGGCYLESDYPFATNTAAATADRVFAIVTEGHARSDGSLKTALASIRADGSDRRVVARGSYRVPVGFVAATDRVAWWQARCGGGDEVVVQDGVPASAATIVAPCRGTVLTRAACVRHGAIGLQLRCRTGCTGMVLSADGPTRVAIRSGTRTLRVAVSKADRRRGRLRLSVEIDHGPSSTAVVSLRG